MNEKYHVNSQGKVNVITDTGDVIEREGLYTQNTDKILSLENAKANLESKVNLLKEKRDELSWKIKYNKLCIPLALVYITIFASSILLRFTTISTLSLALNLAAILSSSFLLISSTISIIKNTPKVKHCNSRIEEESHTIKKINKIIEILSKDKTPALPSHTQTFIDVEPIYDFKFSPSDYFAENYAIAKREKENIGSKTNSKKLTRKPSRINNGMYEI